MTDVYPPFRYDGGGSETWVHTAGARSAADRVGSTGSWGGAPATECADGPATLQEQVQ